MKKQHSSVILGKLTSDKYIRDIIVRSDSRSLKILHGLLGAYVNGNSRTISSDPKYVSLAHEYIKEIPSLELGFKNHKWSQLDKDALLDKCGKLSILVKSFINPGAKGLL